MWMAICILIIETLLNISKQTEPSLKPLQKVKKMYIYLIKSGICENSIDALRSYSAKQKQRIHLSILFSWCIFCLAVCKLPIWLWLMSSYCRTCSTMSAGTEKSLTGVRLVIFCSRASCWMACMICWVCLMPTLTAWQKSCCSTFSADASIITDEQLHIEETFESNGQDTQAYMTYFLMFFWHLTHLTARTSCHNQVKSAGAHFCPSGVDQQLSIY